MAFDFSNITDEELEAMAAQSAPASGFGGAAQSAPQKPLSEWTDEELEAFAAEPNPAQSAANPPRMTREERIAANNRAIETARSQEDPGFLSVAGDALAEGAKGAARAVKSIGSGIVGMASGAVRLAGTPVRLATGWEGLHRLADTIDSSYENFGADALMSDYGENPDGFGFAAGRFGEKLAGTAGSLAALGGVGKAVGAAGTALKAAGHAKTAAAVANTLPLMFGNDAAVRAYDTARANGKSKGESAALAGLNGAIHFLGFKAFENKALNKMLGMPAEMEGLMPKWAGEAAEAGGQSFSSLARGVRNGMIKYTLAERGKGALKAGGIMGLQDMLSDPVMQVAEGASIDDIDFSRMLKAGASGLGEGALMEGALGAASVLKSPSEARKFIADKIFRGKDYKVRGSDGKMHDEPGLLNTSEGRMVLMKQNPDATERVLDIVEHGGTPRPAELDAAFLPPDMTAEELKKFASDWRNDLKPYVDEAWAADAPRQTSAPDAAAAEPGRDMLSPEEAQSQQKAANDAAERQKVADRRAAADSMMLDFESWNRLYADGKTDLNFDEWRAAGKPGVIEANLTPKTEEAPTSETRANEEPAQPEQAEVVAPATGAEARPVEGAEARAEAADARVVESPAKPAEAAQKPAEAAAEPKVGEDTPAPAKPAEVASRASYATPERKAPVAEAEDAPLPSFLAPETAPAEPPKTTVAEPKSAKPKNLYTESKEVSDAYADAAMARYDLSHGVGGVRETNAKLDSAKARLKQLFKDASTEDLLETFNGTVGGRPPTARKGWLDFFGADMANMGTMLMRELESRGYTYNRKTGDMDAPPAEPSAKPAPKSKRLRRADGTDPLAEKEKTPPDATEKTAEPAKTSDETAETRVPQAVQTGEVSSPEAPAPTPEPTPTPAEPTPVKRGKGRPTMTPEQKAKAAAQRAADKVRKIADISRDENGAFRTDMLKASESNPGGLSLKELASLKANKEWHRNLGLPEKDADALRAAVEKAHDDKYLEYHYQSAHDKFADYERGNGDLAFAYNAVSDAASRAKTKGDTVGEQLLQPMLKSLTDKIGALPKNEQNKILAKSSREADTLAPKERKNRKSLTTKEGKEVDVATSGEVAETGEAEEAPDEYGAGSRFNRIEANDDDSSGRSAPKGATGTGGSLGGNRHLIIDGVKGDELTVTMKDAAGKTLATRKMNRAQWSALSQGAVATDGDPANPQKGDLIRMSRNGESPAERNFRFASDENYQKWLKSRKANDAEPLRERYEQEQAKAAKSIARNTLPGVDVEVVDRAFNPETDGGVGKRKSIGGIFTGGPNDYANRSRQGGVDDGPSLKSIGMGEGAQVYGWGLYGSDQRGVAERYAKMGKDPLSLEHVMFDGKLLLVSGIDTIDARVGRLIRDNNWDVKKVEQKLRDRIEKFNKDADEARRLGWGDTAKDIDEMVRAESEELDFVKRNGSKFGKAPDTPAGEHIYEQTFFADRAPGDESHLLKWYSDERPRNLLKNIRNNLSPEQLDAFNRAYNKAYRSGPGGRTQAVFNGDVYKILSDILGSSKFASEFLRDKCDIDGVKYPVDSYRGPIRDGDKAGWNYVSFRDDNIRVDHKWEDGQMRYLRDGEGRVVGTFDRSTNKVTLYRGASATTLVHELGGHATLRFAEQEAERGNRQLLDRINRAIDEAPQALKDEIRSRYPRVDETALRDEIWAALRERNSPAMEKAIKTLQGKAWYNRAWSAFRDAWKGLLARMGFNRADLSQIDKMSNDEFLSHLDRLMSDGKTLGRLEAMGEGTRNAFAGEEGNEYEASRDDAAKAMPDTKIVGSDGKPIAGYHFTKSKDGFTVFDREKSGPGMFGKAFYFFPSKRMAENWGNFDGEKRKVIGAYLNVKKPWVDSLAGYDERMGFDKSQLRRPTDGEYAALVDKLKSDGYEINPDYSYNGMVPYKYVNGKPTPVNHGLAFLSNALVHKSDRGGFGWKHAEPVRKALEELGYDGVVGELDGYTQIAVFEPNQIKSADSITYDDAGNPIPLSQRFNPKSNDIREARSPRPAGSRIMDDQQTKGEKFTEKFIDSLAPVKSVQDELGGVKEITRADGYTDHTKSTDLVAAKDKANGRLEHEVRQHQFRVDDINRDLSRAALPKQSTEDLVDDFNLYLQCKHAPERNLSVAQDRGDTYTPDYSEGMGQITLPGGNRIGLSENVADRLLRGMRGKYGLKFKMFENAADKVYKMLEADLDRRFDAGRLSAEDYAFYKTRWHGPGGADGKWAHYVPLKTDMERLEPEALNSSTAGMKRNEFMKAQGRGTGDIADSPLAAAVLQTEQGIRGSIRNEVANVEANLVEHAQKQGIPIAEIVPGDEIRRGRTYSFTFADGETVDASGSMRLVENHPEIHLFKRDGKLYAIRYDKGANGRGLAFARAASGENMGRWGQGTEWIPRMTHWMSAMRTQYSPEFTVSNWLADHLEAAQALVGRYGLKEGGKAFAKTVASEIRNWKDLRAYLKDGTANGYIKEFVEGGGLTKGGVASEGFDAETQKIRSKIEQFRREQKQWREMSPADLAKSLGRNVTDFLSFANELAEYSTRTGLYTALRKQGVPKAEAIKFARDATVNFNRKGTAMPYINGLYMFANASVQGAVRSVQAMRDTHGKELVAALTAIGVAKAVIDNYLGNDDEREAAGGRNARNQSEYDKKHNVGVPIGGGRQIVPLRFRGPYAAVPYLAQTAANVAMGATSPEDGAKTLFRELGDQVTDIVGGNGIMNDRGELDGSLIGQSIAPSVADPIVQLATGKDYKGDERVKKSFDKTTPASSNGKRSTASGYKMLAKGINYLTGGNELRKGLADFAPEDYQLVLEFLGGAPMRDINNVASSVNNAVQLASGGTPERTLSQIPFVRRVVREYPESTSRYYDALEEYERDKAEFKKTTPERRREMKSEKPYLFMGKSLLDGQIERIKDLTHLERGEVKVGQKWVEPKTPRTEEQKEKYRKLRLEMQARVLKRLGQ